MAWLIRLLPPALRSGPALRTGWPLLLWLMLAWRLAGPLAATLGLPRAALPPDLLLVARKA